jgi:hypothetical protein
MYVCVYFPISWLVHRDCHGYGEPVRVRGRVSVGTGQGTDFLPFTNLYLKYRFSQVCRYIQLDDFSSTLMHLLKIGALLEYGRPQGFLWCSCRLGQWQGAET